MMLRNNYGGFAAINNILHALRAESNKNTNNSIRDAVRHKLNSANYHYQLKVESKEGKFIDVLLESIGQSIRVKLPEEILIPV